MPFIYLLLIEDVQPMHMEQEMAVETRTAKPTVSAVRMGYLLSQYPAISHTFFLQEVLGLRARGLRLETASINRPDRPSAELPPVEATEARRTHYIKDRKRKRALRRVLGVVCTRPGVVMRGLKAVLAMKGLSLRERLFWLFYLAEALLVGRWMKQRNLSHLHVHFGGPVASVGLLTSIAWQVPYSLTIHGPEELLNSTSHHLKAKLDQAKFVFCISDFCRSQLCALTPTADWHKFTVIRLGVDPLVLTPPSRIASLHSRTAPLRLVCTGRMVPEKGHIVLLEAIQLLRERGIRVEATLIGAGPERKSLEDYATRHRLTDVVHFTGALSHQETLGQLRRADLFALASFAEGIPVSLMEAMSLGLPCVGTCIAGIPELIRDGIDGLLVPPANATALANALGSLLEDHLLRRNLGSSARQRIIHQYNLPLNQELLAHAFQLKTAVGEASNLPERGR